MTITLKTDIAKDLELILALAQRLHLEIVEIDEDKEENDFFYKLGMQNFSTAYGDDEPEYTLADLKEVNPYFKQAI